MAEHPFRSIDQKWQKYWEDNGTFRAPDDSSRPKFYTLNMFPYPSAATLHMGNVRTYVIGDVLARFKKLNGFNVMNPMGWDAFGLPAEIPAIREGTHPADWIDRNVKTMKRQLNELGIGYDWDREVSTCAPDYYRWTQWIFLKMFERGLAYRKTGSQNWCATCQTVLANEEAEDGTCWRCHTPVTKKELEQWFLRITAYADRLLDDLKRLDRWPDRVKIMQGNWIGRSDGARVVFRERDTGAEMPVFTTRPDTLFGVTFMVIAPEHPLLGRLVKGTEHETEVSEYVDKARKMSEIERAGADREKTGVFTGRFAVNPVNAETVPLFVADYVLLEYGSGIVMGVPAHDQRDFEFAKKNGLAIKAVITPTGQSLRGDEMAQAYVEDGVQVNSGQFDGMPNRKAIDAIVEHLGRKKLAERAVSYRLRDWLISRQRYWGAPIPMIHCDKCGAVPVPEKDLPVLLPREVDFSPGAISPLARVKKFVEAACPKCAAPARRETDTMATFMDSSWYFLRYCSPRDESAAFNADAARYWMPVDQYVGGIEHAVLHLLYARFFQKVFFDLDLVRDQEPFAALFPHGMVLKDGELMSKSKGNTVVADDIIARHGCDTVRSYLMFAAPPAGDMDWSDSGIEGIARFLRRVDRLVETHRRVLGRYPYDAKATRAAEEGMGREAIRRAHQAIMRVSRDIEKEFQFNTALSAMMEFSNALADMRPGDNISEEACAFVLKRLIVLLSPFAPHVAEEWWEKSGESPSIFGASWPAYDASAAVEDEVEIAIQVNGRLRATLRVGKGTPEDDLKTMVLREKRVKDSLAGGEVKRWVMVPDKLVNLVLR